MKAVVSAVALLVGLALSTIATPAAAVPARPDGLLNLENPVLAVRWVCDRRGNCVWRGTSRRTLYYGPANWRHCEYRWRVGNRGPYRERICW